MKPRCINRKCRLTIWIPPPQNFESSIEIVCVLCLLFFGLKLWGSSSLLKPSQEKLLAFIWMLNVSCVLCLLSLWLEFPGLDFTLKYSSHIYRGQLCSSLVCVWCQSLGVTRKKGSLALHGGKHIWIVTTENWGGGEMNKGKKEGFQAEERASVWNWVTGTFSPWYSGIAPSLG